MDAIGGLDEEGFRLRPREGEWTAAEVLTHILMTEHVFADRARAVLAQDGLLVASITDQERSEQARSAQRMPVPQIVHGLLAQRRDVLGLLEPLSPQQLRRPFRHERRGELAAGWLFQRIAEHEEEHAGQIRAQRAQPAARQA